jgi:hypothetical protein
MLIRILGFILETIFFFLIAAALLRAWMNGLRVNMRGQPGSFVMALTDWLGRRGLIGRVCWLRWCWPCSMRWFRRYCSGF